MNEDSHLDDYGDLYWHEDVLEDYDLYEIEQIQRDVDLEDMYEYELTEED